MITVGRFTMNGNELIGPKAFMDEQGNTALDLILEGKDEMFNTTAHFSPNLETAILVRLQTLFAGWRGMKEAENWTK